MSTVEFEVPRPDLQIAFHAKLGELADKYLLSALLAVVGRSDIGIVDRELRRTAGARPLRHLASLGLRGEILFPIPYLLRQSPWLVGYYRLLLGFSQKELYGKRYGFSIFRSMEAEGRISKRAEPRLDEFCKALCGAGSLLLAGIAGLSKPIVHDLTLLTLGPQLRGGNLNTLGSKAAKGVLELIRGIVAPAITAETSTRLDLLNAAGRLVTVQIASDPDIAIQERLPSGRVNNLVAIEIKGGLDESNVHNRIGEAEKSHQKARVAGYVERWTLIGVAGFDLVRVQKESPSTTHFFSIDRLSQPGSNELKSFGEQVRARVGISD